VPFDETWVDFDYRTVSGESQVRVAPQERAGNYFSIGLRCEPRFKPTSLRLAAPGQRKIRQSSVLTGEAPLGLTVSNQIESGKWCNHELRSFSQAVPLTSREWPLPSRCRMHTRRPSDHWRIYRSRRHL